MPEAALGPCLPAARAAFMSGNEVALAVGAVVALAGAGIVLARLPAQLKSRPPDPDNEPKGDEGPPPGRPTSRATVSLPILPVASRTAGVRSS